MSEKKTCGTCEHWARWGVRSPKGDCRAQAPMSYGAKYHVWAGQDASDCIGYAPATSTRQTEDTSDEMP